jgi:hypothetical protein
MTGIYEQFMNTHGSQTFHIYFFPIGKSLGERGKGVHHYLYITHRTIRLSHTIQISQYFDIHIGDV